MQRMCSVHTVAVFRCLAPSNTAASSSSSSSAVRRLSCHKSPSNPPSLVRCSTSTNCPSWSVEKRRISSKRQFLSTLKPWVACSSDDKSIGGQRWAHTSASGSFPAAATVAAPLKTEELSPQKLVETDLTNLAQDIREVIQDNLDAQEVKALSTYHFDGKGKAIRPLIVLLMARCINSHVGVDDLSKNQRDVAMIAEMIHTASLIHDDVIDESEVRRGRPTLSKICGQKKAILIGDCVLAIASLLLARIGHADVYRIISQILTDLVQGEFMQMEDPSSKKTQAERFAHYLEKTYKKTASLMARPCEAVGVLARLPPNMQENAYLFGRNLGMAFQLVDDLLDFQSDASEMGKPAVNDLRSGIATAPVLFAAEEHPELYEMINRRFARDDDVDKAFNMVVNGSNAITRAHQLARSHAETALRYLHRFNDSSYRRALELTVDQVLTRRK